MFKTAEASSAGFFSYSSSTTPSRSNPAFEPTATRRLNFALGVLPVLRLLSAALAGVVSLVIGAWLTRQVEEPFPVVIATILMAFVGAPALVLWLWRTQSPIDAARTKGGLRVVELRVVAGCQIAETEDEGLHFFLETADGKTMCLSGQFLYDSVESKAFPTELVRIMIDESSDEVIGVECTGKAIRVPPPLDSFSEMEHERHLVPDNLSLFPFGISGVLAQLGRVA